MSTTRIVPMAENALFRGISAELLQQHQIICRRAEFGPGDIIFDEGDAADFLYLVESGAVQITKALPNGSNELLTVILPGDFFGELALYDSAPRSARATAAVPTTLGVVDATGFARLRQLAPLELTSTLADRTIERVRMTNERLVSGLAAAGRLAQIGTDLGSVSHNLRSPLATIRNAADLLARMVTRQPQDEEKVQRFVEIIRHTADRALTQIDELMAELRGEATHRRTAVPVEQLLAELAETVSGLLAANRIEYRDKEIGFRGEVVIDRHEFVSALANLVKNAVEAFPTGEGAVDVSVKEADGGVVFTVADTGPGIPAEVQARLFQRGFTYGKRGGTGMGLHHVRTVVDDHQGRIEVQSEVGRGTAFSIWIPLLVTPTQAPRQPAAG